MRPRYLGVTFPADGVEPAASPTHTTCPIAAPLASIWLQDEIIPAPAPRTREPTLTPVDALSLYFAKTQISSLDSYNKQDLSTLSPAETHLTFPAWPRSWPSH